MRSPVVARVTNRLDTECCYGDAPIAHGGQRHPRESLELARESAEGLCTTWLRAQIMSGALAPGERLRPEIIAGHLGVSRMPVREALRLLDAEGLVTLRANRGATVTRLEASDLAEVFEMRALMEGLCAHHAALRATPAEIDDLADQAEAIRGLLHDAPRWSERHTAFHDRLCHLSGLPRAAAEARRLHRMVTPALRHFATLCPAPETNGHEHEKIVEALREADPSRCEGVVVAHIRATAKAVLGHAASLPVLPHTPPWVQATRDR